MAIPNTFDYVFRDNVGKRATAGYHVIAALTKAQYEEAGQALALLLDAFTNGIVESASMTIPVDLSALTGNVAEENSDVEEGAELGMVTVDGQPVSMIIPSPKQAYFIEGSDDLDTSDPILAAVISMLENGLAVTGGTIQPTDVAEVDLTQVTRARKITRPSGTRRK